MQPQSREQHLSRISTLWTLVEQAHRGSATAVSAAQRRLLERYGGAAHRYLLGALRDADAADELFQEFALRFLRGGFRSADPARGRFRDLVKTALFHLIVDHRRRQARSRPALAPGQEPAVLPPALPEEEQAFLASWREELIDHTWLALKDLETRTGQPCHTVLRLRADRPELSSAELAAEVGLRLGKTYTVDGVRQSLHRARDKFGELLLREVIQSLEAPTAEKLREELSDLGLLTYCRSALERRGCG
jgi:RNA polymerase sigma-70 factor (ECF subfamily)